MTTIKPSWKALHRFWFGNLKQDENYFKQRLPFWFVQNSETDAEMKENFGILLKRYDDGDLFHRNDSVQGKLSLIVLLDQFPRNIYRLSAKAYEYDSVSLSMALELIKDKKDRELDLIERIFLYLPLEHCEKLEIQNQNVSLFKALHKEAPAAIKNFTAMALDYAIAHQELIQRFGRFPHRNAILGRVSNAEELEALKNPRYTF